MRLLTPGQPAPPGQGQRINPLGTSVMYYLTVALLLMSAEALKGHLDALLLATLTGGPRHGYAIKEALRQGSNGQFDLPTGTVYPALHRLERAGLIRGTWSEVAGRQRRSYELTPAGHRALEAKRTDWRMFSDAVTGLLLDGRACPVPSG